MSNVEQKLARVGTTNRVFLMHPVQYFLQMPDHKMFRKSWLHHLPMHRKMFGQQSVSEVKRVKGGVPMLYSAADAHAELGLRYAHAENEPNRQQPLEVVFPNVEALLDAMKKWAINNNEWVEVLPVEPTHKEIMAAMKAGKYRALYVVNETLDLGAGGEDDDVVDVEKLSDFGSNDPKPDPEPKPEETPRKPEGDAKGDGGGGEGLSDL